MNSVKRFGYSFVILSTILLSCKNDTKQDQGIEPKEEVNVYKDPAPKAGKNSTHFEGNWINEKYVEKLLATKSPKKAQDAAPISMLVLPDKTGKEAMAIYNFHEGFSGRLTKKGKNFKIEGGDPNENLNINFKENKIFCNGHSFRKLAGNDQSASYHVAEQLLFAGKYELEGTEVYFSANGKIKGFNKFGFYAVPVDYYDAAMQVDQIRLGTSLQNSRLYGFDFHKNKLNIYELNCVKATGAVCDVVKKGKLLYSLIKKS